MHERIDRYLNERGQLFSAISHDLRTPITRLRLRVELLEDERLQEKFGRDLDELELLVKGALQCVKDTDIHENVESSTSTCCSSTSPSPTWPMAGWRSSVAPRSLIRASPWRSSAVSATCWTMR